MILRNGHKERWALAALLSLLAACSNKVTSPPQQIDAGSDDAEQPGPDVDVDGPMTPEGCQQGQTCECVGAVSACQGGPQTPRSCQMPLDCEMGNVNAADMLCVAMDGGPSLGLCAKRCAKSGGCSSGDAGAVRCPPQFVCEQPPIGASYPVCIVAGALQPPNCYQVADCAAIPGAKCTAAGCILACTY